MFHFQMQRTHAIVWMYTLICCIYILFLKTSLIFILVFVLKFNGSLLTSSVDPNRRSGILHLYKCHYTTVSWCVGWAFQMWLVRTLVRSQHTALLLPSIQFPYSQTYQTARFQPISSHLALARHVLSKALSDANAISGLRGVTVGFTMNGKQL